MWSISHRPPGLSETDRCPSPLQCMPVKAQHLRQLSAKHRLTLCPDLRDCRARWAATQINHPIAAAGPDHTADLEEMQQQARPIRIASDHVSPRTRALRQRRRTGAAPPPESTRRRVLSAPPPRTLAIVIALDLCNDPAGGGCGQPKVTRNACPASFRKAGTGTSHSVCSLNSFRMSARVALTCPRTTCK